MFRGLPADFSILDTKTYDTNKLVEHYGIFNIESLEINSRSMFDDRKAPVKEFKICVFRMLDNKKEDLITERIKTRAKFMVQSKIGFNFTDSIPETLILFVNIEGTKLYRQRMQHTFQTQISILTTKSQTHQFEFIDEKSSIEYTVMLTFRLVLQINRRITFYLHRKQFSRISMDHAENLLASMQTPLIGMLDVNSIILKARHKLTVANHGNIYDLEILNIDEPTFSALKILLDNQTVAMAKVIGLEQLPKDKFENCLSLDIENERAMLIQHAFGDYAIIKAQYGKLGSDGRLSRHLKIQWYSLLSKTSQFFEFSGRSLISVVNPERTIKAVINLKTGFVFIELSKRVHHFEAFLAGLFSITYLYVFVFQNFPQC